MFRDRYILRASFSWEDLLFKSKPLIIYQLLCLLLGEDLFNLRNFRLQKIGETCVFNVNEIYISVAGNKSIFEGSKSLLWSLLTNKSCQTTWVLNVCPTSNTNSALWNKLFLTQKILFFSCKYVCSSRNFSDITHT